MSDTYRRRGQVRAVQVADPPATPPAWLPPGAWQGSPPAVQTAEGWMPVTPGDWLVMDETGQVWPCDRDVFEQRYEAA